MKSTKNANGKSAKLNMRATLLMFALIPIIVGIVISTSMLVGSSRSQMKTTTTNYMFSMAQSEGEGLTDAITAQGKKMALSENNLNSYCADISLKGISSSYCYVADAEGTMLWHPTAEKIGEKVSNEVILGVCAKMANGEASAPAVVSYKFNGEQKYASYYVDEDCDFVFVISADEKDVMSGIQQVTFMSIIVDAVLIVIFIILAILFANKISKPIVEVSKCADVLANGKLSIEVNAKSNIKETKRLIQAVEELRDSLQNAVGAVISSERSLDSAVVTVDNQTASNAESSSQINNAIDEVAKTSQSVAESAQVMAERADSLGTSIDHLVENVENLKNASDEISEVNNTASEYMKNVMHSSADSVEAVQGITEKINQTNEAVDRINECVAMIEDIASQTNLLSLNASIEAARAGEAGRGFAVVAEEIRKLADDSQASAAEIKNIIDTVINISRQTVEAALSVSNTIEEEQRFISETQEKFGNLSESVEHSINEIYSIQGMTEELKNIKNELTGAISDLGAISEELGASAEEVSATSNSVAEACNNTQNQTQEMRGICENLSDAISVFEL